MSEDKIERARAMVAEWQQQERASQSVRDYGYLSPSKLIKLANDPAPIAPDDLEALDVAWYAAFGEWLCEADDGSAPYPIDSAVTALALPADDDMLSMSEVLRVTGISKTTVKRRVQDGTFPKPVRLSVRRMGWPAVEVKAWLAAITEQSTKSRH